MTVYIVIKWYSEKAFQIHDVFDSKKKAEEYIDNQFNHGNFEIAARTLL